MRMVVALLVILIGLASALGIEDYILIGGLTDNPALFYPNSSLVTGKFMVKARLTLLQQGEDRSSVVYDSYESRMGENVFATSTKMWLKPSLFEAVYRTYGDEKTPNLYLGFRENRVWQGAYKAKETQRDPSYMIISNKEWESSGELFQSGLLIVGHLPKMLEVELNPGYIMGKVRRTYHYQEAEKADQVTEDELKAKGMGFNGSIRGYLLDNMFTVLASYTFASLKADWTHTSPTKTTTLTGEDFRLPATAGFTIQFTPPAYDVASLYLGIDYSFWKKYSAPDDLVPDSLSNTWTARMGVAHMVTDNLIARIGLAYAKSPIASTIDRIHIGVAGQYFIQERVAFGIEYGHTFQSFTYDDIKDYVPDWYEASSEINFKQNAGHLNLSLEYKF